MKKLISLILTFLLLVTLIGCTKGKAIVKEMGNLPQSSSVETINENDKTSKDNGKTVIEVNAKTTKMCFRGSNTDNVSNYKKEYVVDKNSQIEHYKKDNMVSKSFNILGVEYVDIPYYNSEKNKYTAEDNDIYEDENSKIGVRKDGEIFYFSNYDGIQVLPNVNENTEEIAKKYLQLICPDFEYDIVRKYDYIYDTVDYQFWKTIDGIPTTEGVSICINNEGELCSYLFYDVGKYDNIEIKGVDIDDYLLRVNEYTKAAYGDKLINYTIGKRGPRYDIFDGNELELSIPIVVNINGANNISYTFTEEVVFELN